MCWRVDFVAQRGDAGMKAGRGRQVRPGQRGERRETRDENARGGEGGGSREKRESAGVSRRRRGGETSSNRCSPDLAPPQGADDYGFPRGFVRAGNIERWGPCRCKQRG
jgi:hypothetical protein